MKQTMEQEHLQSWLDHMGAPEAFAALADLWPDAAVFAVDRDRNVVLWSKGAERLLGFAARDLLGQHCLKGSRCAACMQGCGLVEHGVVQGAALEMYRADGGRVPVRKYARAFTDAQGQFMGGVEMLVPAGSAMPAPAPAPPRSRAEERAPGVDIFHGIVTRDPGMKQLFATVRNVAKNDVTVLVRGESGSGKELFARAIHAESHRRNGPFLAMNCAAVTPSLLESELFGHEKGAFTGALHTYHGLFERADRGTLFLDEVAELSLELQAKLLRVLEERTFFRVGGQAPIQVDVRIVSATHQSLRAAVAGRRFREDLMYRLRVVPIFLPPLRDRQIDIPILVEHFIARMSARGHRAVQRVDPEAMQAFCDYPWPGNVRELKNAVEYALAVGQGPAITFDHLPPEVRGADVHAPVLAAPSTAGARRRDVPADELADAPAGDDDERERITAALAAAGGHLGKAAELLGMSRPTLWRKRRKLEI
ncbi:MAG TPA: sigma 54-interacting transcriptional regulator [Haliangium sp.]|nr:sigma 54-interacting transcriptional regulator [Haliangium sp.]